MLLGRPGEFVRPYLIAVKERVPVTSQLAIWVLERIFDLLNEVLSKRSLESTVVVDDTQVVVLGGLIQDQMASGSDKIPLLGDIPIAGALFRYDSRQRTKTNLMIFIKPTVLRTSADGRALTSERYDYLRGEQDRQAPPERLFWNDPTQPALPREGVMPGAPGTQQTPPLLDDGPKPAPLPQPVTPPLPGFTPPPSVKP